MKVELIEFPDGKFGIRKSGFVPRYYAFNSGGWFTRRGTGEVRLYCKTDEKEARQVFDAIDPYLERTIECKPC